jgi:hypothetical protein
VASESGAHVLQRALPLDLSTARSARMAFHSWFMSSASWGEVQVRGEDGEWTTLEVIGGSDTWTPVEIDLSAYLGEVVEVRIVFYAVGGGRAAPDVWRIEGIALDVGRRRQ